MPKYRVAVPEVYVHYEIVEASNRGTAIKAVVRGEGEIVAFDKSEGTIDLIGPHETVNGSDYWLATKICDEPETDQQLVLPLG